MIDGRRGGGRGLCESAFDPLSCVGSGLAAGILDLLAELPRLLLIIVPELGSVPLLPLVNGPYHHDEGGGGVVL